MPQIALPSLEAVVILNPCEAPPPVPVVTTVAPVRRAPVPLPMQPENSCMPSTPQTARRAGASTCSSSGPGSRNYPPMVSSPPPPRMTFATPRVVGGVVYVCIGGFGEYTCAFTADDGTLRWWTPTDARVASMPFMDCAVPLVKDGIVYSGTYALNAQDGTVLWRIPIDTHEEGSLALHALVDETLYATTTRGIYAINAQDGQIRWLYQPEKLTIVSGPAVVSGRLLYSGTSAGFVRLPADHGAIFVPWMSRPARRSGAIPITIGPLYWRGGPARDDLRQLR